MKLQALLFIAVSSFSMMSMAFDLKPGSLLPPPLPMENLTEAYETNSIEIGLGMNGKIKEVYASQCPNCTREQFKVTDKTQFLFGTRPLQTDQLTNFNGKSGTVVFYPDTHVLESVLFFDLED